jgi:hypothetical protein
MVAAILAAGSVVALGQFGICYWRSIIAGVAAQPLSDRVRAVVGLTGLPVGSADFKAFMSLHELTPGLEGESTSLGPVRAYYHVVGLIERLAQVRLPALAAWSKQEMATCSRYVAVLMDRRLERNLACAAEIRSC